MLKNKKRHAAIMIGCPNVEGGHLDFTIIDGRYICNICKDDFTNEMKDIYYKLLQDFAN